MSFNDQFSRIAASYATFRPKYPPALADWLADAAARRELAWDCGCGNGQLSTLLADRFVHVIASDASEKQIANATPHEHVDYRVAPAEASGLRDRCADLITVAQAAHWFDLTKFYAEARRVGRRPSVLALINYGNMELADEPLRKIVGRFYWKVTRPFWDAARTHVENALRDIEFPFDPIAAPEMKIESRLSAEQFIGYVSTWSGLQNMLKQKPESAEQWRAFQDELTAAWSESAVSDGTRLVRWPLTIRAGRIA